MATADHLCPFGLKSRSLLVRRGYAVDDNTLTTRGQQDAFKDVHQVQTTPQAFIDGERIGGYDDLRRHLGLRVRSPDQTTYAPVLAIFGTTALMALALVLNLQAAATFQAWLLWFIAFSMCALAIQKLRDVEGFVNGFLGYDLLARRYVPYGYVYPFAEAWAGIGMIGLIGRESALVLLVAPVALVIGGIGAVSVVKAVYVDRRDIRCACVGGDSKVPLGAVSLTENLMMLVIGGWMLLRWF
ncbi:MAG: MauE/DoxX family redox-associated membrane protein [Lautropia sp.]